MADVVDRVLEHMLPELEDLQKRGIFTPEEIKAVVRKRRDFEYLLRKRIPDQDDYTRYLEYELNLEALRRRRKARLGLKRATVSDHGGIRHMHFIFDRATRKFRTDPRWWLQWIDFAMRTNSTKAVDRIFGRALQLHPRCEELWLQAAQWQFDRLHNMSAARALMQRALRVNGTFSRGLWLAYFRMECIYIQKVRGRRALLGLDIGADSGAGLLAAAALAGVAAEEEAPAAGAASAGGAGDYAPTFTRADDSGSDSDDASDAGGKDEDAAAGGAAGASGSMEAAIAAAAAAGEGSGAAAAGGGSSSGASATVAEASDDPKAAFFAGAVPRLVFDHALAASPELASDVAFRIAFLTAAASMRDELGAAVATATAAGAAAPATAAAAAPGSAPVAYPRLVAHILTSLASDFPSHPLAWEALASYPLQGIAEDARRLRVAAEAHAALAAAAGRASKRPRTEGGAAGAIASASDGDLFVLDTAGARVGDADAGAGDASGSPDDRDSDDDSAASTSVSGGDDDDDEEEAANGDDGHATGGDSRPLGVPVKLARFMPPLAASPVSPLDAVANAVLRALASGSLDAAVAGGARSSSSGVAVAEVQERDLHAASGLAAGVSLVGEAAAAAATTKASAAAAASGGAAATGKKARKGKAAGAGADGATPAAASAASSMELRVPRLPLVRGGFFCDDASDGAATAAASDVRVLWAPALATAPFGEAVATGGAGASTAAVSGRKRKRPAEAAGSAASASPATGSGGSALCPFSVAAAAAAAAPAALHLLPSPPGAAAVPVGGVRCDDPAYNAGGEDAALGLPEHAAAVFASAAAAEREALAALLAAQAAAPSLGLFVSAARVHVALMSLQLPAGASARARALRLLVSLRDTLQAARDFDARTMATVVAPTKPVLQAIAAAAGGARAAPVTGAAVSEAERAAAVTLIAAPLPGTAAAVAAGASAAGGLRTPQQQRLYDARLAVASGLAALHVSVCLRLGDVAGAVEVAQEATRRLHDAPAAWLLAARLAFHLRAVQRQAEEALATGSAAGAAAAPAASTAGDVSDAPATVPLASALGWLPALAAATGGAAAAAALPAGFEPEQLLERACATNAAAAAAGSAIEGAGALYRAWLEAAYAGGLTTTGTGSGAGSVERALHRMQTPLKRGLLAGLPRPDAAALRHAYLRAVFAAYSSGRVPHAVLPVLLNAALGPTAPVSAHLFALRRDIAAHVAPHCATGVSSGRRASGSGRPKPEDVARIRQAFDAAATVHGASSSDLWIKYMAFERAVAAATAGRSGGGAGAAGAWKDRASDVYARAVRTLKGAAGSRFVEAAVAVARR